MTIRRMFGGPAGTGAAAGAATSDGAAPDAEWRLQAATTRNRKQTTTSATLGRVSDTILTPPQFEHREAEQARGVRTSLALPGEQRLDRALVEQRGIGV